MSKESHPGHSAGVHEEEHRGIADSLEEQDTIRRCDADTAAAELKHGQQVQAKKFEHFNDQAKERATDLKDEAKQNAQNLKDQTKANADKFKL